jgi:geranylgeranyl diphosphate synthase type I
MTIPAEVSPSPHRTDTDLIEAIDAALAGYLTERAEDAERVHHSVADACAALRKFVLAGGKRVRPTFAWWGWRGAGGDPDAPAADAVLRAISALELVQANALLHDDVMDASRIRRGRPTVHVAFAQRHRALHWLGRSDRFGESAAILLGDLALAWADDMFHGAGLDEAGYRGARPVWASMRTEMLGGQYLDVWTQVTGDRSVDAALRVDRFKTAAHIAEPAASRLPELALSATRRQA